ncbi:hypothetical protein FDP41_006582 [Naegleria fowleri]|uniref:Uncharacterized protein n=1 Tax=Naegleria fowleri TaxID=5763 RepID=A0A6A5BKL4_NAEFO|nr:uncharacterized protein FDP41_006582 [Naegleria fowleri]KAF0974550.1 hypothetical protein FDP41_006582 [Naegleria fowleri]
MIKQQHNKGIESSFFICKVQLSTKEDLRKFVNVDNGFKTKDGRVVVKQFISSIDNISAKIAKSNEKFPSSLVTIPNWKIIETVTTKSTISDDKRQTNIEQTKPQTKNPDRIQLLENRLSQMERTLECRFSRIDQALQVLTNYLVVLDLLHLNQTVPSQNVNRFSHSSIRIPTNGFGVPVPQ